MIVKHYLILLIDICSVKKIVLFLNLCLPKYTVFLIEFNYLASIKVHITF